MKKIDFFDDFRGIQKWHDYLAVFMLIFASLLPFLMNLISFFSKNNIVDSFIAVSLPLFIFSFLSPFVEEVVFRLCAFRWLRNKIGIFSHFIVAILFVICHMSYTSTITSELILIIPYFFISVILSVTYEKLQTPVAGILARILYNSVAVTASFNYRGIPPLTIILLNAGHPHRIY